MENKIYYGVINLTAHQMCEKLFNTADEADSYATQLDLLPEQRDAHSVVKIDYNPNFL